MAYDGQYFYGSNSSSTLYQMDLANKVLIGSVTTGVASIRHIAYDSQNDGFWVGGWDDLYLISRAGVVQQTGTTGLTSVYGTAYDPWTAGGPYLWMFNQGGANLVDIMQYSIPASALTGVMHDASDVPGYVTGTSIAGGLCISTQVVPGKISLIGNIQESPNLIFGYDLGEATAPWISYAPTSGILAANESQDLNVHFDATGKPIGTYYATIIFTSDPDVGNVDLPITLNIIPASSATLTIPQVTGVLPGPVSVPVHATELNNLGAFQFTIEYDPALMTYIGTSNWYPGISDILIGSATPGILSVIWAASLQGITIADGTFFNLDFTWLGSTDTSPVAWTDSPTQREFSDYNGMVIVPIYTDGGVTGTTALPHFTTVWSGNPLNPMSIIVTQATLDQVNLAAGDEIGIFDGAICVGAYKLTAPIDPNDPPFIIVSKDDPGTPVVDGYTEGHTIDYKIWKLISDFETSSVLHTFPFAPLFVFETFTQNETAVVILSGSSVPINTPVQNVTIPDGVSKCYNATQTIAVAGNGTTFLVENGGSATMIAGQNILFLPGTTVQSGGYLLGYIAPNGPYCQSPAVPAVIAGEAELPASFENSSFTIYPNPTTGKFILELKTENLMERVNVEIYGLHGEKVQTIDLVGERKHEFSLTDRPDGVYLIRVIVNGKAEHRKMIKY
jgi:hypothetical protein